MKIIKKQPRQSLSQSFASAFRGFSHVLSERNFVIQLVTGVIVLGALFVLHIPSFQKLFGILAVALVLFAETTNSACERMLDLYTLEHNEEVGRIKEMLAASVLIVCLAAIAIGVIIFNSTQ